MLFAIQESWNFFIYPVTMTTCYTEGSRLGQLLHLIYRTSGMVCFRQEVSVLPHQANMPGSHWNTVQSSNKQKNNITNIGKTNSLDTEHQQGKARLLFRFYAGSLRIWAQFSMVGWNKIQISKVVFKMYHFHEKLIMVF